MNKTYFQFPLLIALLTLIYFIYLPGTSGAFYYDDFRPLSGLSKITNFDTILAFVFLEPSGTLGRPLSMLTFLLNINDWPTTTYRGNSSAFFTFNILLHLTNGLLVFLISYLTSQLYRKKDINKASIDSNVSFWVAFATSAFWLVLPMHVSTSLIAIQRMAGLSAFFVFFGIFLYLYGLTKQSKNIQHYNNDGLGFQLTGLILFTLLAMFSKENGILLPVFILVLEVTLLNSIIEIKHRQKLRVSACFLGLLTILSYLAFTALSSNNILPGRDFTLTERIITQPLILLEYLQASFFPDIDGFNPFHDNHQVVKDFTSAPKAILSVTFLCISLVCALIFHKKYSLFSFAVLWYLAAHLLESSTIGLELYFEHRNYVALFGPCLAIVISLLSIKARYKKPVIYFFITYWILLAVNLSLTTQLWGKPAIAAQTWYEKQPGSVRASENFSLIFLKAKNINTAYEILEKQVNYCPSCMNSRAQALFYSCFVGNKESTERHYRAIEKLIPATQNSVSVGETLSGIKELIDNKDCSLLSLDDLININTALLGLPKTRYNIKFNHLKNLYDIAIEKNNITEGIRLLQLAWIERNDMRTAEELVTLLLATEQYPLAETFIEEQVCNALDSDFISTKIRHSYCLKLQTTIKGK